MWLIRWVCFYSRFHISFKHTLRLRQRNFFTSFTLNVSNINKTRANRSRKQAQKRTAPAFYICRSDIRTWTPSIDHTHTLMCVRFVVCSSVVGASCLLFFFLLFCFFFFSLTADEATHSHTSLSACRHLHIHAHKILSLTIFVLNLLCKI